MKTEHRIIIVIAALLLAACYVNADSKSARKSNITVMEPLEKRSIQSDQLLSIINNYRGNDGFDIITIGSWGTSLLKKISAGGMASGDEDLKNAFKAIKSIRKIAVVDFSDCGTVVREEFVNKMDEVMSHSELLMEVKDDDDNLFMYGVVGKNENMVKDLVVYDPDGGTLICLFGSISIDAIMKMAD